MVFRQMRLHVQVGMLAHQRAGHLHLLRRRGDREARRHRVVKPAPAVPFGDQRLGVVVAGLRRVGEALGRIAVHHHLAADDAHAARQRLGEERVRALAVDGTIGGDRRRAVADQLVQEQARDAPAVLRVAELRLFGKGVGVQPVEQLGAVAGDHLHLREMRMRVDEARHHEMRAMIDRLDAVAGTRGDLGVVASIGNAAVTHEQAAILLVAVGRTVVPASRFAEKRQQPGADQERAHSPRLVSSNHATSNARSSCVMPETLPGGMAWLRPAWR